MTQLVLSWLVHFMLYYPLIMRHVCGMHLIHERSETTLPWSTACDSGTTPRIHYSVKEKEKNISHRRYCWKYTHIYMQLWSAPLLSQNVLITLSSVRVNNANSRQISKTLSQLCVLSACNLSRKEGSPAPGPGANLWSVSAEHGDLSFSADLFDLSADVPKVTEVGTDVSTPV